MNNKNTYKRNRDRLVITAKSCYQTEEYYKSNKEINIEIYLMKQNIQKRRLEEIDMEICQNMHTYKHAQKKKNVYNHYKKNYVYFLFFI